MSEIKLKPLGKAMAKQMARSWEAPQFQLFTTLHCGAMMAYRASLPVKTSYTTILAKAVTETLKEFPVVNSSWDDGTKIIQHESVNMGIAVDTKRGLVVPVIPDADQKSIEELNAYMLNFKEKSATGAFSMEEISGGTFIISNLGMFNVTSFSAIVNAPNAAILSVGKMVDVPVWNGEAFVPDKAMELGLSLDHRVVDGATGARFLTALTNRLEHLND